MLQQSHRVLTCRGSGSRPTLHSRCTAITVRAADAAKPYHRSDSLVAHKRIGHDFWRGYVGNWFLNPHDPSTSRTIHGLRTFKWRDASREVLDQVNVYDTQKPPSSQRALDDLWEAHFFYDHSNPNQDKEEVHVSQDDKTFHLMAVSEDAYGQVPFSLPSVVQQGPQPAPAAGSPTWGTELFMWDGKFRWSLAVHYDRATGDLDRMVFVQEGHTDIKPSTANVLKVAAPNTPEPRESLDADEGSWLRAGAPGSGSRLHVQPVSGLVMKDEGVHAAWSAPSVQDHPANCVILLPDAMYAFVPLSLALLTEDKQGCRFEFGGLMRTRAPPAAGKPSFQRVVLDYDLKTGSFAGMQHHRF